jgi:RNA polymerase sigma factor (sigma-70 family)
VSVRRANHPVAARGEAERTSDPDLLRQLAGGEIGALGELYDRYREPVRRFVARATSDAEDVDDLVHATFLAAAKIASRYDGRASCRPWLVGIAAQLLRRRRRSLGRLFTVLSSLRGIRATTIDPRPAWRRERTRLLAAFDHALVSPAPRSNGRRWRLGWAAVAALVAGVLVLWRVRSGELPARASAVVHADSTAEWSERTDDNHETVLPDGELEDTGTTFTVSAAEGHTTRVAVHEGSVVLRLRGLPPAAIGEGDTWIPEVPPAAAACASAAPPVAATDRPWEHVPPAASARMSLAPPPPSAPPRTPSPAGAALEPASSVDFRAAMAALDVGDNAEAAAAFASFLARHPRDPRAEDAAYLRVIALQRSGDSGSVRWAAQEYLRRYPEGFRRAEMEALAR